MAAEPAPANPNRLRFDYLAANERPDIYATLSEANCTAVLPFQAQERPGNVPVDRVAQVSDGRSIPAARLAMDKRRRSGNPCGG